MSSKVYLYAAALSASFWLSGKLLVPACAQGSASHQLPVASSLSFNQTNRENGFFNVRSFGARGDGVADDQKAIAATEREAANWTDVHPGRKAIIYFPRGTYSLTSFLGAYAINLNGLHDIAIRGELCGDQPNGFCSRLIGAPVRLDVHTNMPTYNSFFRISNSSRVSVSNFFLDKATPYFSQGLVQAVDPTSRTIDIVVSPGFDDFSNPVFAKFLNIIMFFRHKDDFTWDHSSASCESGSPAALDDGQCYHYHIIGKQMLAPSRWRLTLDKAPLPGYKGQTFLLWRNIFWQPGFMIEDSRDVMISKIFYTGGGGSTVHIQGSEGDNVIKDVTTDVPPGSGRMFAATSGFNGARNRGTLSVEHVHVARTDDDAVHFDGGYYYPVLSEGNDRLSLRLALCYGGDFRVGDHVSAWDWSSKRPIAQAQVISSSIIPGHSDPRFPRQCDVRLDHELPLLKGMATYDPASLGNAADHNDRIVNDSMSISLLVTNSYLSSMRARCAIIQTSATFTKDNCAFAPLGGFLVGPEYQWGEGYAVKNVKIDSCSFANVGGTAIHVADVINGLRNKSISEILTRNFIDNSVEEDNENLTIINNTFSNLGPYGSGFQGVRGLAISIENAKNVTLRGNKFENPSQSIVVSPWTTSSVTK